MEGGGSPLRAVRSARAAPSGDSETHLLNTRRVWGVLGRDVGDRLDLGGVCSGETAPQRAGLVLADIGGGEGLAQAVPSVTPNGDHLVGADPGGVVRGRRFSQGSSRARLRPGGKIRDYGSTS